MTTVIHHSADYDGIFCREIARKFMPEHEIIGWDFGQEKIPFPKSGRVYILDLPPDCMQVMGDGELSRLIWIDHHKSAIEKWKDFNIAGYRIDGVAACRLAWQYFAKPHRVRWNGLPRKEEYLRREVYEPLSVRLAGEYDVWDHRDGEADIYYFQFGLDSYPVLDWDLLLFDNAEYTGQLIMNGHIARECYRKRDADIVTQRGFDVEFEGLRFRALNTARCNSNSFTAAIRPEHDGCLGFYWNGSTFVVSLYGVPHKPDIDLSKIAAKYGGGGHKQACGFAAVSLPWIK